MLRRSKRTCKSKVTVESSPTQQPPIKRQRKNHVEVSDNDSFYEDDSSGDEFVPTDSNTVKDPCSLNLSESDSDNDPQDCFKEKAKQSQKSDTESEDDENICQTNFDFTSLLNPQETAKLPVDDEKSKNIKNVEENGIYDNTDVAKILSVGEGVNLGTFLNNTDNNEDEELKRDENYTIPKMVEVTVKLPNDMKCKKGQDLQNVLRRRMNTICKETQVSIHKVNLLLWIAYGNYLNRVINSPEVMASALSLVPSKKAYPPKQCDLKYLEDYIKWFSKNIKITSKTDPLCEISASSLVERFSKREAKTRYELIAMFISMLRSLGLNVRLVINLNAISIKPNSEQLLAPLTDEDHMKPSSSQSKVNTKQKTPAKSEYFNKKPNKSDNCKKKLDLKNSKMENEKTGNKKSKVSKQIDENISSTDEDEIFVKSNKRAKSKYFNEKRNKSDTDLKKSIKKNETSSKQRKSKISEKIDRRVLSTDEEDNSLLENNDTVTKKKVKNDFWVEVFLEMEEKWFCVDVIGQRLHCIKEIYVSV